MNPEELSKFKKELSKALRAIDKMCETARHKEDAVVYKTAASMRDIGIDIESKLSQDKP